MPDVPVLAENGKNLVLRRVAQGLTEELSVLRGSLRKMGFISGSLMSRYRRHAIVAILIVAAIITPTTDVFTLCIVSLPIWLLYEVSIWIVKLNQTN